MSTKPSVAVVQEVQTVGEVATTIPIIFRDAPVEGKGATRTPTPVAFAYNFLCKKENLNLGSN